MNFYTTVHYDPETQILTLGHRTAKEAILKNPVTWLPIFLIPALIVLNIYVVQIPYLWLIIPAYAIGMGLYVFGLAKLNKPLIVNWKDFTITLKNGKTVPLRNINYLQKMVGMEQVAIYIGENQPEHRIALARSYFKISEEVKQAVINIINATGYANQPDTFDRKVEFEQWLNYNVK